MSRESAMPSRVRPWAAHAARRLAVPALLAALTAAHAADPLPPEPRTAPAIPGDAATTDLSPELRLQRLLADLAHDRARAMEELRKAAGAVPAPPPSADPAFAEPRRDRDRAWEELRTAMDDWMARAPRTRSDPVEVGTPAARAAQAGSLSAANRLLIADCVRELLSQPGSTDADLAEGLAAVDGLDVADLPDGDRPRAAYLTAALHVEAARRGPPDQRARHAGAARAAAAILRSDHPASELTALVDRLLGLLPAEAQ